MFYVGGLMRDRMNSKERGLAAYHLEEPDRVPMDFWADESVWLKLCGELKVEKREELLKKLHIDFRHCYWAGDLGAVESYADGSYRDWWGVVHDRKGIPKVNPLANVKSLEDLDRYDWPDPDKVNYYDIVRLIEAYTEDYVIYGGAWSPIFFVALGLTGMEKFFKYAFTSPEIIHRLLDIITGFYYEVSRRIFELCAKDIDVFFMGDDYGTQRGLFLSRKMFREFFKPRLEKLFKLAKKYGLLVQLHSCGSIRDIIPDLIEIGLDGLDPIQVRAANMSVEEIKREFGDKICIHGSLDTQKTLPFGSTDDVKMEVLQRFNTVAQGGGFVLAPSQVFLPEIPIENILTMYKVGYEYGHYPYR
jgi:uroporphyrinogen decarboxylase